MLSFNEFISNLTDKNKDEIFESIYDYDPAEVYLTVVSSYWNSIDPKTRLDLFGHPEAELKEKKDWAGQSPKAKKQIMTHFNFKGYGRITNRKTLVDPF